MAKKEFCLFFLPCKSLFIQPPHHLNHHYPPHFQNLSFCFNLCPSLCLILYSHSHSPSLTFTGSHIFLPLIGPSLTLSYLPPIRPYLASSYFYIPLIRPSLTLSYLPAIRPDLALSYFYISPIRPFLAPFYFNIHPRKLYLVPSLFLYSSYMARSDSLLSFAYETLSGFLLFLYLPYLAPSYFYFPPKKAFTGYLLMKYFLFFYIHILITIFAYHSLLLSKKFSFLYFSSSSIYSSFFISFLNFFFLYLFVFLFKSF
ncbi:unnamed protein product [Acanthosepion pharaonis]|uniref:Uncharacterized protein n=1 Tax=Acanthosepion pharaonis TaxID=158019 RepID=A0A812E0F2_ACAPH|nr:unnamed protein product [Sepia pharaonis]